MTDNRRGEKPNELSIEEQLELQKIRMKAKFGSLFGSSGKLDPKAELEWLQQVENFEDAMNERKMVKVREVLKDIKIKPLNKIPKEEIEKELGKLLDEMEGKKVSLSILAETPPEDVYEFIVDELLDYEMQDMRGTVYTSCFTYEDFHPNDKYDIEQTIDNWITGLCSIEFYTYIKGELYDEVETLAGEKLKKDDVMEKVKPFGKFYENPDIKKLEEENYFINEEKTEASFSAYISYTVENRETGKKVKFEGKAFFELKRNDLGYWGISKFNIPGLRF